MKTFSRLGAAALLLALSAAAWAEPHVTYRPEGPTKVGGQGADSCDIVVRYDDGTDDLVDAGYTLGYFGSEYQFLGVRFTPPPATDYEVVSASFYAEFWVIDGPIEVEAAQADDPSNATTASVFVNGAGVWSVQFATPICVPAGKDYVIMLCSTPDGGQGVTGEDMSAVDNRSYYSLSQGCDPVNLISVADLMIWSCVEKCGTVPATEQSWGSLKSLYR